MKVLFVLEQLNIGGPQKSLLGMMENIDFEKHEIDVLLMQNEGKLAQYMDNRVNVLNAPEIIDAFTFPVNRVKKSLMTFWHVGGIRLFFDALILLVKHTVTKNCMNVQRQKFWVRNKKYLPELEKEYDIAFGYSPVMSTYYVADCVKAEKKCHWVRCDYRILDMDRTIEEAYFKRMNGIVAVSQMCRDIFTDVFPCVKKCATFFYNFIPTGFYKSLPQVSFREKKSDDEVRIITVTRVDMFKGLDIALEACALLKDKIEFTWHIVGDGNSREYFEEKAKELEVADKVVFLGFQLNVLSCLEQSDIFVHPSLTEGKSNAVDEAKAFGMPVIVTNYPTVTEQIMDEVTGLICEMNGSAVASAILRVIDNRELAGRLKDNCKENKQLNETPDQLFNRIVQGDYSR